MCYQIFNEELCGPVPECGQFSGSVTPLCFGWNVEKVRSDRAHLNTMASSSHVSEQAPLQLETGHRHCWRCCQWKQVPGLSHPGAGKVSTCR